MKRFSEQLHKKAASVKLQATEKRELRERVFSYMEYHPLPAEMKVKQKKVRPASATLPTEAFTLFKVQFHTLFKYGAIAAAVVLVVVPFVAERAMPGDALYAVKVQFNEELRGTLTFDSYQKVEWETERLNRRIAEARLLANEGRLTNEVEAEVAEAVRTHTENAKREIEVLRTEDADEAAIASIALDTTLEVQSTSLKGDEDVMAEEGSEQMVSSSQVSLIADVIDESRARTSVLEASSTPPGYAKLMARVEENTTRMYELLGSLRAIAPTEELNGVQRRIEDVERSIQAAIELAEADDVEARQALVGVLQRTQRLIVFMTELEVNETVDIETLVPVELTATEQVDEMSRLADKLAEKVSQIESLLLTVIVDESVLEKVEQSQTNVAELSARMASSTEDFATFRELAGEANALADDTIELLERFVPPVEPEEIEVDETSTSTATSTETEASPGEDETQATSTEEIGEELGEVVASSTEEIISPIEGGTTTSTETVDSV